MTKSIYIRDIKAGDKVSETFLVQDKNYAFSQKGSAYLGLRLKDRTGELEARVWENAAEWDQAFRKGDFVQVNARAVSYRNTVQLNVLGLKTIPDTAVDYADYYPAAARNAEEMFADLLRYVEQVETPPLRRLLLAFFQDEEIARLFKKAPAAKGFHHVYAGGLLEHTLSVTRLLDLASAHYRGINRDLLLAGGILHDIGKIYEFSFDRIVEYSDRGRLIGHIVMGLEMMDTRIAAIPDFPEQLAMELRHVILSHHGALEYGSPKRPKTLEALIVNYMDDLDAKVNAFQCFIKDAPRDDSDWTPFHRLFDRYIYKGKGDPDG